MEKMSRTHSPSFRASSLSPSFSDGFAVDIENLSKEYPDSQGNPTVALEGFNLGINREQVVCIVGRSGCGKSTLLNIISGMITDFSGKVSVFGRRSNDARKSTSYLSQDARLVPYRTILQNAVLGVELGMGSNLGGPAVRHVCNLLERLGIEDFLNHYPSDLSGGMRQRVALARALAVDKPLLLCDEPFSALDFETRIDLENFLWKYVKDGKKTSILVTHDIETAIALADRVVVMTPRPGRVMSVTDIESNLLAQDPLSRRRSSLFSSYFSEIWSQLRANEESCEDGKRI